MLFKRNIYPSVILLVLLVFLTTNLFAGSSSNNGEISIFLIITGLLGGLVAVGFMSQIVFGTGWLGIDVIGNITGIVNGFLGAGLTGLITLVVLVGLWESK